ncbi:phage tail protein [Weissella confusa]|uniref:Phage tail protein n=1 Tax=Weissella confusa TaxID=1583 RepID=A0A923SMX0_WEICO|nr:phage tail protein [Weissella confusa]
MAMTVTSAGNEDVALGENWTVQMLDNGFQTSVEVVVIHLYDKDSYVTNTRKVFRYRNDTAAVQLQYDATSIVNTVQALSTMEQPAFTPFKVQDADSVAKWGQGDNSFSLTDALNFLFTDIGDGYSYQIHGNFDSNQTLTDFGNTSIIEGLSTIKGTFGIYAIVPDNNQVDFQAYDDGSLGFTLLQVENLVQYDGQTYVIKQATDDNTGGVHNVTVTATHIFYQLNNRFQYNVRERGDNDIRLSGLSSANVTFSFPFLYF